MDTPFIALFYAKIYFIFTFLQYLYASFMEFIYVDQKQSSLWFSY